MSILLAGVPPRLAQAAPEPAAVGTAGQLAAPSKPADGLSYADIINVAEPAPDTLPDSLSSPLSISRVQAAYQADTAASGRLRVTFRVTNNQPSGLDYDFPLPATDTITAALEVMPDVDFSADPNIIRDVLVTDEFLNGAAVIDSSAAPQRRDGGYAWNIGDIAPQGSVEFTLELRSPAPAADFIQLDRGATAWGVWQGQPLSASALPITLAPPTVDGQPIGDWLRSTIDANTADEDMLAQAAELGQDPLRMFAFVRSLGYHAYQGSLRGTRGTIWNKAGNALDKSSLLIAMLRAGGIPARYRHGALDDAATDQLLASMFAANPLVVGDVPQGGEKSDPLAEPELRAEARDHWWVEAYLPGIGWRDLDPSFGSAQVGQRMVGDGRLAVDGTDRIAEVPDALRHKATVKLKIEEYHPLNIGTNGLKYSYPLERTFNTVELVGKPVSIDQVVNTTVNAGFFYVIQHSYLPTLSVERQSFLGQSYQEIISNFPLGTFTVTGQWLIIDVRSPDGKSTSLTREIVDKIGFENRQAGGTVQLKATGETGPSVSNADMLTMVFAPGAVPEHVIARQVSKNLSTQQALSAINAEIKATAPNSAARTLKERDAAPILKTALMQAQYFTILSFYNNSDHATAMFDNSYLTESYMDSPRVVIASNSLSVPEDPAGLPGLDHSIDLLKNDIRTIAQPGQATLAELYLNHGRGMTDIAIESDLLKRLAGADVVSTFNVMRTAQSQGIPLAGIAAQNIADLQTMDLSTEAKARIRQAASRGMLVVVPERMVTIGSKTTVGWYEMDPVTGVTIDTMENGRHQSWIETKFMIKWTSNVAGNLGGFSAVLYCTFASIYFAWQSFSHDKAYADQLADELRNIGAAAALVGGAFIGALDVIGGGATAGGFFNAGATYVSRFGFVLGLYWLMWKYSWSQLYKDPPMPQLLLGGVVPAGQPRASAAVTAAASHP
ncbi:MAG TPA: transglutaminase family protein, partial [Herpetosiphonaceae bacterium]|nr:transglutaminase family protein [Herpetosiphonaceae bacterium]